MNELDELTEKEKQFLRSCIWTLSDDLTESIDGEDLTLTEIRDLYAKLGGENTVRKIRAAEVDEGC